MGQDWPCTSRATTIMKEFFHGDPYREDPLGR
jgi:hypothetical protein